MSVAPSPESQETVLKSLDLVVDTYFRAKLIFKDPKNFDVNSNSYIFASNHSGMSFPWDAIALHRVLRRHFGARLTVLAAPALFRVRIMEFFGIPGSWSRFAMEANMVNYESVLKSDSNVLVYPEGVAGIGKGFNNRYRLQKFSSSTVRMCLRHHRELVPIYTVNGEYLNPFAYKLSVVNNFAQKLGIPFLPLGFSILLVAFIPLAFYMAWPAQLNFIVGTPIDIRTLVGTSEAELSGTEIRDLTDRMHSLMQSQLDQAVKEYGDKKYDLPGLMRRMLKTGPRALLVTPLTWPFVFHWAFLSKNSTWAAKGRAFFVALFLSLPLIGWPLYLAFIYFPKTKTLQALEGPPK